MPKIVFKTTEDYIYVGELLDSSSSEIRVSIESVKNAARDSIPDYIIGLEKGYRGCVSFSKSQLVWYYTHK